MARKDRARARKRHAIDRARREAGVEPQRKPAADSRQAARRNGGPPARRPAQRGATFKKLAVGDVDRKGRVFQRNMVVHPGYGILVYLAASGVAVFALVKHQLGLAYLMLAVGPLMIADSQPTKRTAFLYVLVGVAIAAWGAWLIVSPPAVAPHRG
jgi:hypothetical protein